MHYQSVNPFNGQVLETFEQLNDQQIKAMLERATSCFENKWKNTSFEERAAVSHKAASIMRHRKDEFARLVTLEMGKLINESRAEVQLSADIIDYFANNAEAFLAPLRLPVESGEASIENFPLGVLLGIEPWNFPYYQLARFVAPSMMAGNVIMLKHASSVPQCALAFERMYTEAGAPEGPTRICSPVLNRLLIDRRSEGDGGGPHGQRASRVRRCRKRRAQPQKEHDGTRRQ